MILIIGYNTASIGVQYLPAKKDFQQKHISPAGFL